MTGAGPCGPGDGGEWVFIAAAGELAPGTALTAAAGDLEVAVFDLDGELVAVEARCLHKGGALAEGHVNDGIVTCPLHWWRYNLRTGERLGASDLRLACYPVRLLDDRVEVFVPSARPPAPSLRERLLAAGREWEGRRSV